MRGPLFLPFISLVPLILATIPIVFICHRLAREKGKDVTLWTILGIIPLVNYFVLLYLVGAVNVHLQRKVDRVLSLLEKKDQRDH
jgi:hypothetical protein